MIFSLSNTGFQQKGKFINAEFGNVAGLKVGDDVFKDDPTVNELEHLIATKFGMESALFFPSGTMANQTAIKIHTQPGDQLICDKYAHVYNYEGGGVSFNSGVSCKLLDGNRGMFTNDQVISAINPPDFYHSPKTSLVCAENTTNKGGGACWDIGELKKIQQTCKENNLYYHLDGARIWNAIVNTGTTPLQYGKIFDSISVCLSKGLGCPVGSILLGSTEFINKAIKVRKLLGGGMRQAGYLAACGIYALKNNIERLNEDHIKAKEIESVLKNSNFIRPTPIQSQSIPIALNGKDILGTAQTKSTQQVRGGGLEFRLGERAALPRRVHPIRRLPRPSRRDDGEDGRHFYRRVRLRVPLRREFRHSLVSRR